ncbi:MAG: hypothetical protein NC238_04975 [Dehalobacter sp.]|nr:hypothetical protein [Dehalobacter sp.]
MQRFTPERLNSTMDVLRETVLLPHEFAERVSRNPEPGTFKDDFSRFQGSLESYAFSLGKRELEDCLVALIQDHRPEMKSVILQILKLRMSPRLISLIRALTQYFYELPEMRKASRLAANSRDCSDELLHELFDQEKDIIEAAVNLIHQNEEMVSPMITRYRLITGSPFCKAVIRRFFQDGNEESFLLNEDYFLEMIDADSERDLVPVVINYLDQTWTQAPSRSINRKLLQRFGLPEDEKSIIWENTDADLIAKYRQWVFLDMMEDFFGPDNRKYLIFSRYYQELKHIGLYHDDQIMVLDFGQFGILDLKEMAEYSWLMEKSTLEMELETLQKGEELRLIHRKTDIEARDVIIEEKSSDILVLNLTGVGKLYVAELMGELLRRGEEIWPVKFKHAISRFREKIY